MPGVRLVPNFISESEEQFLLSSIDCAQWAPSQSGRQKQDYGPRINFKAQRVNTTKFVGLPDYVDHLLRWISEREGTIGLLDGFSPVELCNLEYSSERLSSIDLHKDDAWIWGERLVSISLNSDCVFMLEHPDLKLLVFIPVPRRSLLCLFDRERFVWNHGIFPHHIYGRRVAITLRELAKAFLDELHLGNDIMKKAAMRIETKTQQNFSTI
uniref:2OG-FeII_Oxy_2 domain-containing protein n=1 Tax=Globodera pallida TaxID=36090 RepID=A0A183C326_GLOPA